MARASSLAPWGLLLAAAAIAVFHASPGAVAAGVQDNGASIGGVFNVIVQFALSIIPGAVVAFVVYTVYTRRSQMTPKAWGGLVMLSIGCVLLYAVRMGVGQPRQRGSVITPSMAAAGLIDPNTILSGEAIVTKDNRYIKLPDPTKAEGEPLEPGWQRALAGSMTEAIRNGQEQVVLVFSRQGCPWCERQKPVLERAIKKRTQEIAAAERDRSDSESDTAFIGGGGAQAANLLFSPLRVFVLDAGEFPYLAQQFRIEAFPTSMVFGPPGATPLVAQGYLDDETMDKILKTAAVSTPPSPGRRGGRRKRRGLFR